MEKLRSVWESSSVKSVRALDDIEEPFRSCKQAAKFLLQMGLMLGEERPHLIAFTAGGAQVARELACLRGCPSDYAAVEKIAPPELGGLVLGAAAFDGTLMIDGSIKAACAISRATFKKLVEDAYARATRVIEETRGGVAFPSLRDKTAVVVDDGCPSPIVTRVAIAAARNAGATRVVLALPSGQRHSVRTVARAADMTYCANLHYEHRTHDRPSAHHNLLGRLVPPVQSPWQA